MSTKPQRFQRFLGYYREQTSKKEVDMHDVARFAQKMGWSLPVPPSPLDVLAKQFADAAREELRIDKKTKRPYRANLSLRKTLPDGKQQSLWIDTDDEHRRHVMVKALNRYREQMVGEAVMGTNTADHWSRVNQDQRRIDFETDFGPDVKWRSNEPQEGEQKAG